MQLLLQVLDQAVEGTALVLLDAHLHQTPRLLRLTPIPHLCRRSLAPKNQTVALGGVLASSSSTALPTP